MVTIETERRTLIVARMDRGELHNIAPAKRAGLSLTRYGKVREGGLIEVALGSFAMHLNYSAAA